MVIENAFCAVCDALSVTRMVKLEVPVDVGVPLIVPAMDNANPAGNDPEATAQLYGGVPPLAAKVAL